MARQLEFRIGPGIKGTRYGVKLIKQSCTKLFICLEDIQLSQTFKPRLS
jgi:hypothetical protein